MRKGLFIAALATLWAVAVALAPPLVVSLAVLGSGALLYAVASDE